MFVCALQKWNLFPPVPWKPCHQTLLAFKARFPGDSQSLCQIPRLGSLSWCLELSQWENFFGVIILQPVGHPLSDYGIWFYRDCAPPTISLHLPVFERRVSFLRGFCHPPVDGGSTASCDFGALAGRDKPISFYSPILNWKLLSLNVWNVLYSDLKLITSFQRQVHKVILIESPVTYPPPSERKKKVLVSIALRTWIMWERHLPFHLVFPASEEDCSLLKRGLHFCSRFCLTKYTQFPSPPLPHPCWLSLFWTPPEMALPVCILLFLGKCLLTFKSQFTCLWPVCLSLPPICSCFLWVSKGLYANSYSQASHSWVIIFYSFIPQTFVKLPECFRHYPRSLGIQQRTS